MSKIDDIAVFLKYSLARARDWYSTNRRLPRLSELGMLLRAAFYQWTRQKELRGSIPAPPDFKIPERKKPYEAWLEVNGWNPKREAHLRERLDGIKEKPLLSVLMPVYNAPLKFLDKAIKSVVGQVYGNWELCIADDASTDERVREALLRWAGADKRIKVHYREKNGNISIATNTAASMAKGRWFVFLDQDDELTLDALAEIAVYVSSNPETGLLYSDDDKTGPDGRRFSPQFKPGWSPELLLSYMYFSHVFVIRRELFFEAGQMREGFEGSQDYDLALRAAEKAIYVGHIPLVLYHWRVLPGSTASSGNAKPGSIEAGRKAVQEALDRRGMQATAFQPGWAKKAGCGVFSHRFVHKDYPSVTIIITAKNQKEALSRCVESVLDRTEYPNYRILIADNNSDDPDTISYLSGLSSRPNIKVVKISGPEPGFSRSYINNRAAEAASSDYLLFLDNDTEVVAGAWLSQMAGYGKITGAGAIGARLLFPDKRIQHAGLIHRHYEGLPMSAFKLSPEWDGGYLSYAKVLRNYSAVTAACLLTPRDLFLKTGGFDEKNLRVAYNDIDYCYRLLAEGYRIIYTPDAELMHHEGFSRGINKDNPDEIAYFKEKYSGFTERYYNQSLSVENGGFEIQPRSVFPGNLNKKINLLMCAHNLSLEGAPYSQYELAVGLRDKGIVEPVVFCHADGPMRGLYESKGIRVILGRDPLENARTIEGYRDGIRRFAEFIKGSGFEVVYGNTLRSFHAIAAAEEAGLPSIWNPRESEPWQSFFGFLPPDIAAEALKCFQYPYRTVFVADATKNGYNALNSRGNFTVIKNGLNLERLRAESKGYGRDSVRAELGIDDGVLAILLPGTICDRKGQIDLPRAFEKLSEALRRKASCFIVGDRQSAYSAKLHALVGRMDADTGKRIRIVPETGEILKYFKAADIFVCSSRFESYPRVVLEAMAFSLPIITTPVFGIREQVMEGVNAFFYDPGDTEGLKGHLEKMIEDRALREAMSVNSMKVLKTLESFEGMVDAYGRIIQEAYFSR